MERLNKINTSSSEINVYSTLEKIQKEFEVSTDGVKLKGNVNKERDYNQVVSYSNDWLQNLVGKKEFRSTEKYSVRDRSATTYTSYFPDYLKIEYNNPEFQDEQEEDTENGTRVDQVEVAEEGRHHQLDTNSNSNSEFININEVIPMEIDDSHYSEGNKQVAHFEEFTFNNISEFININEVKTAEAQNRCLTSNCNKPHSAKGYCLSCYRKYKNKKECNGCGLFKGHGGKGYCHLCYRKYVHKETKKQCKGCGLLKPHSAKGYCLSCYKKYVHKEKKKQCIGCGLLKPHHAKGYCHYCYQKYLQLEKKKQ